MKRIVGLAALVAAAACASPIAPHDANPQRSVGILQWGPQGMSASEGADDTPTWSVPNRDTTRWSNAPLTVPQQMKAGVPFDAIIRTIGPDGCWSKGETRVEYRDREILVTPYDQHSGAEACTEILAYLQHRVQLTVPTPGEVVLRVEGRQVVNGRVSDAAPTVKVYRLNIE